MKVLHVIPTLRSTLGGPAQVAINLARALNQLQNTAEIVTTDDNGPDRMAVPLNQRIEYQGVPVYFLPRTLPPMRDFIFSATFGPWLWSRITEYDMLELHGLFSYTLTCAATIARWRNIPYTIRTCGQLAPWALAQSRIKKQIYSALFENANLQGAIAIHCTSAGEAADIRKLGLTNPLITLPLGVEETTIAPAAKTLLRQRYSIPDDRPIVLYMGRFHYKKRPDFLLQVLGQLQQRAVPFHLILAGAGSPKYTKLLQDLVQTLGLGDRVLFPGFVTGAEKNLLLQAADIFVLPSFSENFAIAVAEAMSAGVPVVITPDVQIAPDVITSGAGLVVSGDADLWQEALAQLLVSPDLRQKMGHQGRQFAQKHYVWQAIAERLVAAYSALNCGQPMPNFLS